MLFILREVENPGASHGTFSTGAEAGKAASELNEQWRAQGLPSRVRVLREAAPASQEEPTAWIMGGNVPNDVLPVGDKPAWAPLAKPIPASGADWRMREMRNPRRYFLPWGHMAWWRASEHWAIHFPYPAHKDHSKIAFTASEEHGLADRQTVVRPGVYLERFFGDVLSASDVQYWALEWANRFAPCELLFAKTADEIENVYTAGPSSCMAGSASPFVGGIHPCRAYAGPDLQVAYIRSGEEITGRAVVWPEKLQNGQVYGDIKRMEAALDKAGYSHGSLVGARLSRIESPDGLHLPYLDGENRVMDIGNGLLRIDREGDIYADSTHGVVNTAWCENCEEPVYENAAYRDPHDGSGPYCGSCFSDLFTYCEGCCEYFPAENAGYTESRGPYYCDSCYMEHFGMCAECEEDEEDEEDEEAAEAPVVVTATLDAANGLERLAAPTVTYTVPQEAR